MSIVDYIQALLVCRTNNISMLELASRSIADMLLSPALTMRHAEYRPIGTTPTRSGASPLSLTTCRPPPAIATPLPRLPALLQTRRTA